MRTFPKRSNGQDVTEMNIYESPAHLPDLDTRIHFAARLRHNSHCHFAAGIPIFPAAIGGIIEETVADEMPFTDEDTLGMLANLIDPGTCENLNGPQTGHFTCSACGADGPLGKVRLPDDSCKNGWRVELIKSCPYCGRKVVAPKRTLFQVIRDGTKAHRD